MKKLLAGTLIVLMASGLAFAANQSTVYQNGTDGVVEVDQIYTYYGSDNVVKVTQKAGSKLEEAYVYQMGDGNKATTEQSGTNNRLNTEQIGSLNKLTVNQSGKGNGNPVHSGENNVAWIQSHGFGNWVKIKQGGSKGNDAAVFQGGAFNAADIGQTVGKQVSEVLQRGFDNKAKIRQTGSTTNANYAAVAQGGTPHGMKPAGVPVATGGVNWTARGFNTTGYVTDGVYFESHHSEADIAQSSINNKAGVIQSGESQYSKIRQSSRNNMALTIQGGCFNDSDIAQSGNGYNTAVVWQNGYDHSSDIDQTGSYCLAEVNQFGFCNDSIIKQTGTSDSAFVTQGGSFNLSTVNQLGGSGNVATVNQF